MGCQFLSGGVCTCPQPPFQSHSQIGSSRYRQLLSVADVENAIVDEIELYPEIDYQSFNWEPVNRAFERLRKIADERAQEADTR